MLIIIPCFRKLLLLLVTVLVNLCCISATSQVNISKPTFPFNEACPRTNFNSFDITFTFTPVANLASNNVFSIELSDANGSFSNPTVLATSTTTVSPTTVNVMMPTSLNGTGYKIRVKSSAPAATSPSSDAFPGYYAAYVAPFVINNFNATQSFCVNSNYILKVDEGVNSPTQFPELKYIWYRNNVIIPNEMLSSLIVNQEGMYYARIDYGDCYTEVISNQVQMVAIASQELNISSFGSTTFCESEGLELVASNLTGQIDYQWYNANGMISGATNSTYTATTSGSYYLIAETTSCTLTSNTLNLTAINGSNITTSPSENNIEINEGGQVTISAFGGENYQWFIADVLVNSTQAITINEATTVELVATINGCIVRKVFIVTVKQTPINPNANVLVQNIVTQNNDGINDTWIIPDELLSDNVEVTVFDANNRVLLQQKNYQNNWPQNSVPSNTTYYYVIKKDNSIMSKGTISIFGK